jgi:D-glycero-D-manno-heptose 1,7-bisphosphate phosphatase
MVHAGSLPGGGPRLAVAAAGLARRGHEVFWTAGSGGRELAERLLGAPLPESLRMVPRGLAAARVRAEVAVGGGLRPRAAAMAGWLARAHCLVLGLEAQAVAGWGALDRWTWDSLHASGIVDERDADEFRRRPRGLDLERVALWSSEPPPARAEAEHPDVEILERACERALARHRGRAPGPAVFLDRDGTLVVERGYLADAEALEVLPGVPGALRRLRASGFALVVISNQSGIGRGLFPAARAYEAMARLRSDLRPHGAEPDAIYFCPHTPEAGCACRKPGTALLERAAEDLMLDLARSFMVGDKAIDAAAGVNAGGHGILLRTGYGREEERRLGEVPGMPVPHAVCDDLAAAADWILQRHDPSA